MKTLSALALCAFLTACGGSSGGGDAATAPPIGPMPPAPPVQPPPVPTATLNLSSPTFRTLAGGSAIPITAALSSGGTVRWQLAPGAPGSLSADSGNAVSYRPPADLAAHTTVTVTASGDGASAAMTLAVAPDPGLAGLTRIAWRPPAEENEPTMLRPRVVRADHAGNVYILLLIDAAPLRRGPPELVKVAPDGTITKLIGRINNERMWFGQADTANNAQRLYFSAGYGLDRAGNLYFAVVPGASIVLPGVQTSSGPAILKITPAGVISVLAGTEGEQIGAMLDGTGSAARFLEPSIVGVDPDGNVYVSDRGTPRKVTPAGVVTTLSALPASLNADMNGNTYRWDEASRKLMRVAPDGTASVETSAPYCSSFVPAPPFTCLDERAYYGGAPIDGASYALISDAGVHRLVLRR
ncbi:hypothetical protein [Massilia sp. BSC265]|uniref:hypothetical protein n=1 Tax=Massilia sp. BSC265 TaxID=1549812 RepID=UPI0004E8F90A|nr:hypothetical protein [Massilia sp. BSC265]KFI05882.1 hypothetical protein JN27_17265 [Massilia sp. BSC265]